MILAQLLPIAVFAVVSCGTPGPNNVMLLASGANFGCRRTLPHIAGITLGLNLMIWGAGLGLVAFAAQSRRLREAERLVYRPVYVRRHDVQRRVMSGLE